MILPSELILKIMVHSGIHATLKLSSTSRFLNNLFLENKRWLISEYKKEIKDCMLDDETFTIVKFDRLIKEKGLDKIKNMIYLLRDYHSVDMYWFVSNFCDRILKLHESKMYHTEKWKTIRFFVNLLLFSKDFNRIVTDILFHVISSGKKMRKKMFRYFFKMGYNVDYMDSYDDRCSVLVSAIRNCHTRFVEFLVKELGADVNKQCLETHRSLPLAEAIGCTNKKTIKILISHGAKPELLPERYYKKLQNLLSK